MVTLRSLLLLLAFTTFIAIVAWAWSSRRKADFDEAARLPFDSEDDEAAKTGRDAR